MARNATGRRFSTAVAVLAASSLATAYAQTGGGDGGAGPGTGAVSGPGAVASTPLTVDYYIRGEVEYVENLGFSGKSSPITRIVPGATFRSDTETLKLSGNVSFSSVHYWNDDVGTSRTTEPRFVFDGRLLRERSSYGLTSSFYRSNDFFGTQTGGSTGFRLANTQRSFFTFSPNYSYSLTERLSVNANYGFTAIRYTETGPGLVDSDGNSIGGGLQYRLSEFESIGASVSASQYRTNPDTTASDTRSLQVSWDKRWSELTSTTLYVGYTHSEQRGLSNQLVCLVPIQFCQAGLFPFQTVQVGTDVTNRTPIYGATYTTQLSPRDTFSARADRGVIPGASGTLTERASVGLNLAHRYSERLTGYVDFSWAITGFVGATRGGNTTDTTELQRLSAGLSYQLPDNWTLSGVARLVQTNVDVADRLERGVLVALSKTWPNNRLW